MARIFTFVFRRFANLFRSWETKDSFLAFLAPVFVLVLLFVWLGLLMLGYGLQLWAVSGHDISSAFRETASSMFTLGFAEPAGVAPSAIVFAGARMQVSRTGTVRFERRYRVR